MVQAIPEISRQWKVIGENGLDSLQFSDEKSPEVGDSQVLVKIQGATLNYRDLTITKGTYPWDVRPDVVPGSDGAGTVLAVGKHVTRFKPGDKVVTALAQRYIAGPLSDDLPKSGLGAVLDGTFRTIGVFSEQGLVPLPRGLTFIEGAALTCAGVTAWNALFGLSGKQVSAGQWVLTQGTGGVSIFAIQFAKAVGARVIATTSSAEKAKLLEKLGVDHIINYRETIDWGKEAKRLTGGVGVDLVVEVAGPTTLRQSLVSCRLDGTIITTGFAGGNPSEHDMPTFLDSWLSLVTVRGTGCVVTKYDDIANAVKTCTDITLSNIAAPSNGAIDLSKLQTGTKVTFDGTTTFADTVDSSFDPIIISGTNIVITGAPGHVIEGNGAAYWDGLGSNGGGDKPNHFVVVKKTTNAKITNLNIKNWPVHCFSMTGNQGLTVSGLVLDNSAGDAPNSKSGSKAAAHNSDGFDISSSDNVLLENIKVHNQDDCVAVTSGTKITVNNLYCYGGHGLSIGSIGGKSNNTVDGVVFSNSQVVKSSNGCRIKSNSNTTGEVSNVTYKNITLTDIDTYGIDVQQDYLNGGPTGSPTNGVKISGIHFIDVTGTATSDAYNYYILCGDGSCSDITFENTKITGGGKTSSCNFPASGCPA
ncbi:hypothetical protein HER10_EVM0006605 [Colletotrichum scovillei]|uniref:uncharacterized protein n=1 Tax=Colletotrichum scovillei TaxID=1209932 RepID=UPI0015C35A72|nr:uncharacterized protein HER10_EVM0006605 [Colletotrichum scovillei]KAF4775112.1 hypothetical protein HER10_EVM0006605 [Colletotrichum scovillei]